MNDESLGRRIAALREEQGLSQSALARLMGSSQSAVSQIESGERNPSYDTIRQIARALQVTPAHLVGAPVEMLEAHELAHFRLLRSLPSEAQQELTQFAAFLRKKHQQKPKP
jgi:transcriptional regulator with XRE-family HTH domain